MSAPPLALALVAELLGHQDRVWHVSWHPMRAGLLASCGGDLSVRLWARAPGGGVAAFRGLCAADGFTQRTVRCCEWSPCGRFLAAGSFDGNAYVFRLRVLDGGDDLNETQAAQLELLSTLEGHENEVKGVAWSAAGHLLATCSRDKSIWLWELVEDEAAASAGLGRGARGERGEPAVDFDCVAVLHGHEGDVKHVRWHPSRELLLSASYDNSVRAWAESGDDWICTQQLGAAHSSTAWCLAFDAAGERLVTVGDDRAVAVWAARPAPGGVVDALEFSPLARLEAAHERCIFSVDCERPWPAAAGTAPGTAPDAALEAGPGTTTEPLRFATCGADDFIRVFDLVPAGAPGGAAALVQRLALAAAHKGDVNVVRFARLQRDAGLLASGGDDNVVRIWRLQH